MLKQQMFFSRNLRKDRDFPGSTMVKKPRCQSGARTPSLVGELRSHMLCSVAKEKEKKKSPGRGGRKDEEVFPGVRCC